MCKLYKSVIGTKEGSVRDLQIVNSKLFNCKLL
jgi:hypothetical protein